jgi:hypothetical protein
MQEGQRTTNEQGGSQSFIEADFSCIPPIVLRLLAQCLGFGARKYGKENWKNIPLEDNLSHAMNHINEWNRGDRTEPHLVNAMARITFALWQAVKQKSQPTRYIHPDMLEQKVYYPDPSLVPPEVPEYKPFYPEPPSEDSSVFNPIYANAKPRPPIFQKSQVQEDQEEDRIYRLEQRITAIDERIKDIHQAMRTVLEKLTNMDKILD